MDVRYHVNLNNEYEFRYYCTQKSIDAFDATINCNVFPTRFTLLALLVSETIYNTPCYLAKKLVEITVNIFRILSTRADDQKCLHMKKLFDLTGVIVIQLFIPCICTAIRVCATFLGFLHPSWAVQGWRFAENGESLSYLLWSNIVQEFDCQSLNKRVYEEINPANAIFYLGEKQTLICLEKASSHYRDIELEIIAVFSNLLQTIAMNDPDCFYKLLDYDKAIDPKISLGKNHVSRYRLSHDIKQILRQLKLLLHAQDVNLEALVELITKKNLTLEQLQRLFNHIYFNLRTTYLEDELNFDPTSIEVDITQLKDLFSQRFRFGRAHFSQSLYDFHCSASD